MRWILVVTGCVLALLAVAWLGLRLVHSDEAKQPHLIATSEDEILDRFEVRDENGVVLWDAENPGRIRVANIDYAVLPAGWVQRHPKNGSPRDLTAEDRLTLTISSSPHGWARICTRPAGGKEFLHGMTVWGNTCDKPGCAEIFVLGAKDASASQ